MPTAVIEYSDLVLLVSARRSGALQMNDKKRLLFISHSTYDKDYVAKIVDLLRKQGLDSSRVFCSSYPGYGIPGGSTIFEFLKTRFVDYELYVLFVVSKENYYASAACMNEMGAAWVLGSKSNAILLPGTSPSDLKGVVSRDFLSIVLDSDESAYRLTELRDDVLDFFSLDVDSQASWEYDRDRFLSECRELGKVKRPAFVPGIDINGYLEDLTESKVPISQSLKRALRVARQRGDHKNEEWIAKEFMGYERDEDLPTYRVSRSSSFRYSGISGTMKITNGMLPLHYLDEEDLEAASVLHITDDVSTIEGLLSDGHEVARDLSALIPVVLENTGGLCQCASLTQVIPKAALHRVLTAVEDKLIRFFTESCS